MTNLDLSSVNAKLDRAEEHLRAFQQEQATWGNRETQEVIRKVNADFTQWSWFLSVKRQPDFRRSSLIFSDCVHALRCALDHLAYAVAIHKHKGPTEIDVSDGFMFPLAHNEGRFKKAIKDKGLGILGDPVLDAIKLVQPYVRFRFERDGRKFSTLGLLRDLDNHDKHRIVQQAYQVPVATQPVRLRYPIPSTLIVESRLVRCRLEHGAEVATLTIRQPAPDLDPTLDPAIAVCIEWRDWADPNNPNDLGVMHAPGVLVALMAEVRAVVGIVDAAVR